MLKILKLSLLLFVVPLSTFAALASDDPALDAAVHELQSKWDSNKFEIPEGDEQTAAMNALGIEADAVAARFPNRAAALIWDGIITSERASMANAFSALGLANRARDLLEKAYKIDPNALDAGATTSLGVLYYRVPGFPIAFGDVSKARKLLIQAVQAAPLSLDALYFYGDFLLSQGEYAKAKEIFLRALKLPEHADRAKWDHVRRLVIAEDLEKIKANP